MNACVLEERAFRIVVLWRRPLTTSASEQCETESPLKAVPSPIRPSSTPAFAAMSSIILPTVMREGKPCGFMMMSGEMPWSVNGMSSCDGSIPARYRVVPRHLDPSQLVAPSRRRDSHGFGSGDTSLRYDAADHTLLPMSA